MGGEREREKASKQEIAGHKNREMEREGKRKRMPCDRERG